jgi:dienelactone hydrolase
MCHPDLVPAPGIPQPRETDVLVPTSAGDSIPVRIGRAADAPADHTPPPVVVLSDMFGRTPFYHHIAARLAAAGFTAYLPDYFFRAPALRALEQQFAIERWRTFDERRALADADAVLRHAAAGHGSAGVLGFCLGGTLALDLASLVTDVPLATVAYYAFPEPPGYARVPAPAPADLVDEQRGAVLAFWGTEDAAIDPAVVRRYIDRAGRAAPGFRHVLYQGAPHGFLAKSRLADDGLGADDPAGDSWLRTISHFHEHA